MGREACSSADCGELFDGLGDHFLVGESVLGAEVGWYWMERGMSLGVA